MRVVVLLENTASSSAMRICHGLSLYIETGGISFLMDMGPNAMFAQNAQALGVDLSQVRFAVVSHGLWGFPLSVLFSFCWEPLSH